MAIPIGKGKRRFRVTFTVITDASGAWFDDAKGKYTKHRVKPSDVARWAAALDMVHENFETEIVGEPVAIEIETKGMEN
jgi:hypothetical protein